MTISAVLWDYGGVFSSSPFSATAEVAREFGVEPERYLSLIFGPYDRDTDHPWHRLERGEIALPEAREAIIELGKAENVDSDPLHFFIKMGRSTLVRPDVVEFAKQVRSGGTRTALITNNAHEFRDAWSKSIPIDELFDHVVDSSEVGFRKPDPRIFELALDRLGVEASQAVFLDDYAGNVDAATRVGIRGILVEEAYQTAIDELRSLLGR